MQRFHWYFFSFPSDQMYHNWHRIRQGKVVGPKREKRFNLCMKVRLTGVCFGQLWLIISEDPCYFELNPRTVLSGVWRCDWTKGRGTLDRSGWSNRERERERERERKKERKKEIEKSSTRTRRVNGRIVLTFIVVTRSCLHLKSLSFSLNPSESLW